MVSALAYENRRLGLSVIDKDATVRRQCTQARGDLLVRTTDLEITDRAQRHHTSRKQFVIDVKTVSMVDHRIALALGKSDGMHRPINMTI